MPPPQSQWGYNDDMAHAKGSAGSAVGGERSKAVRADRVLIAIGALLLAGSGAAYLGDTRFILLKSDLSLGDLKDSAKYDVSIPLLIVAMGEHRVEAGRSGSCCVRALGEAVRTRPGLLKAPFRVQRGAKPTGTYADVVPVTVSCGDRQVTKTVTLRYRVVRAGP